MEKNRYIVKKVSIMDTLRGLPVGKPVTFDCREVGPMSSTQSAVSRLNKAAGREAYAVTTTDNGATFTVKRLA